MTSKQRAYLMKLAQTEDAIFRFGKGEITPEYISAIDEALTKRELIKIAVLQNCMENPKDIAVVLAERTRSEVVQVIGKKIVLYRPAKKPKILLPR